MASRRKKLIQQFVNQGPTASINRPGSRTAQRVPPRPFTSPALNRRRARGSAPRQYS